MAACVAGFAAAIAVAAMTGRDSFIHLLAIALAYVAASVFVSFLVAGPEQPPADRGLPDRRRSDG
ncbi:MAG TPA: hypothetical protein VIJ20_06980 [Solirubrobacteraceae bacterium]